MAELLPAVLGIAAGLVLGLTGAGGSVLAVPLLVFGLGWSLAQAAPVALLAVSAAAVFGTVVSWDVNYVRYRAAMLMAAAGLVAAPLGLLAAQRLPEPLLLQLFAVATAVVALRLLRQARQAPEDTRVVRASTPAADAPAGGPVCRTDSQTGRFIWTPACLRMMATVGAAAGFLSGLLGVGGGFVIVPALRSRTELSMHSAVATSLMAIALTSGATALLAGMLGTDYPWQQALPFVAGSLAGMTAGRMLARHIAGPRLQSGFALLMLAVAVGVLAEAVIGLEA